MAARGFAVKAPKKTSERRLAVYGWGAGAFVAIGTLAAALQFAPTPSTSGMQFAAAPMDMMGDVDPIITGSIERPQVLPGRTIESALPGLSMQGQLDEMKIEMATLRDALAASQAASRSTLRRVDSLERNLTLFTASVGSASGTADDQPLPARIDAQTAIIPAPRVVLPPPIPVEGGEIAVRMLPMTIGDPTQEPADGISTAADTASDGDRSHRGANDLNESGVDAIPENPDMDVMLSATPFAVDIGGAATLEGIDRLWQQRQTAHTATLEGYEPRILLQQTSEGTLDLRLVVGPIPDAADAAMLCARLVASGLQRCLPAVFDGQQLALR